MLAHMRAALDMADLTTELDATVQVVALVRNCLLHAGGRVDQRLAAAEPRYAVDDRLELTFESTAPTVKALRDLACAVDQQ